MAKGHRLQGGAALAEALCGLSLTHRNLILSIAGNFDWEQVVALAEKHCNTWRTGDASRHVEPYQPAQSVNEIIVDPKLKQQIMIIAMPAVDVKDPDYYAAILGGSILGDSDGSRLFWNIHQ